jgi:hypothetical protein
MGLMFIAIVASTGAGFAGIYDSKYISKAMIEWIALLPGAIALLATTMKFILNFKVLKGLFLDFDAVPHPKDF